MILENVNKKDVYIKRYVRALKDGASGLREQYTLKDKVIQHRLITMLGVAGLGKSKELYNLFQILSEEKDLGFFPISISLNGVSNTEVADLIETELIGKKIPEENKLIVLFDGLDEVHSGFIDIVCSNINQYVKLNPEVSFVVSCRNNFYSTEIENGDAKLSGFETCVLNSIGYFQIRGYLDDRLNDRANECYKDLDKTGIRELLNSPFYLVKIVDYYESQDRVPETKKELFEFLLDERFKANKEKFNRSGVQLERYRDSVEKILEQAAMVMQLTGRGYLQTNEIFEHLCTDSEIRKIIDHTFLFNKSHDGTKWEFEHNNFKEYLAARFLSRIEPKRAIDFFAINKTLKRIKPSWLNTTSFLVSILDRNSYEYKVFFKWIYQNERDALVRFEKDKIPLLIRELVFFSIFQEYDKKQIRVRSEKFEWEDLFLLVSDSRTVLKYLIGICHGEVSKTTRLNAIDSLKLFDFVDEYNNEISQALSAVSLRSDLYYYSRFRALCAMSTLRIYNSQLTRKLFLHPLFHSDQYFRTGTYYYLRHQEPEEVEIFLDNLLLGATLLRSVGILRSADSKEPAYLSDEKYILSKLFKKLNSKTSMIKILEWAISIKIEYRDHEIFELIGDTIEQCSKLTDVEKVSISPLVAQLLFRFSRGHMDELRDQFKEYFESIKSPELKDDLILQASLSEDSIRNNYDYAIGVVANKDLLDYLIGKIRNGKMEEAKVFRLRNFLRYECERNLYNYFYLQLIAHDEKYAFDDSQDYETLKRTREQNDHRLMFDQDLFLEKVKEIFDLEKSSEIAVKDLYAFRKAHLLDENFDNTIVLETLRKSARQSETKSISFKSISEFVLDKERWDSYCIDLIYLQEVGSKVHSLNDVEKDFITDWVKEILNVYSVKELITQDRASKGYRFHGNRLGLKVVYFIRRLDIDLDEQIYIDLIFLDSPHFHKKGQIKDFEDSTLIEWVESKIGREKLEPIILQCLKNDLLMDAVVERHIGYCSKKGLTEALPYMLFFIEKNRVSYIDRISYVKSFLNCGGDPRELVRFVQDDHWFNQNLLDLLAEIGFGGTAEICKSLLKHQAEMDSHFAYSYLRILLGIAPKEAQPLMRDWIVLNKQIVNLQYDIQDFGFKELDNYLFLYQHALIHNYSEDERRERYNVQYLDHIIELASQNKAWYKLASYKFKIWLEYSSEEKALYYAQARLDKAYLTKQVSNLSFKEAESTLSRTNYIPVWKHKLNSLRAKFGIYFEILGWFIAIISVVSIIYSVISFFGQD